MINSLVLAGGWPALDFANTVSQRQPEPGEELLKDWDDFAQWIVRLGLLSSREMERWRLFRPIDMAEVRGLREMIYALFGHYAARGSLDARQLAMFNGYLHEVYTHTTLQLRPDGCIVRGVEPVPHVEKPLWILALSAEALLTDDRLKRVKTCPGCGWLFLDTSKNGLRRWCSMQTCGSQEKARNYYHRKKGK